MRIGEVAKKTGLSQHTLRFYDKMGLLSDVAKTRGGIRDYGPRDMDRIGMIECLKKTGMSLTDIKQFIDWCGLGDESIVQRHEMFIARRAAVERQLADIQRTLKVIDFKIDYYARARRAGTLAIYDGKKIKMPDFFAE